VAAFGEQLRREREERKVSIDAICDATKVSSRYIRALEAGDFAEMPGGVFRKGIVRSYVAALGLEGDVWMQRFEQSCRDSGVIDPADAQWAAFAENVKRGRGSMRQRMKWSGLAILAILLVLVVAIAAWCGWRLATHRSLIPPRPAWLHLGHRTTALSANENLRGRSIT
jgi:cytoskeleton protein RodZ